MKILYYDCFAGISGDMNLAAMLDLGVDPNTLRQQLSSLGIDHDFEVQVTEGKCQGIRGAQVEVVLRKDDMTHHHHSHDHTHNHDHGQHRNLRDIEAMIQASSLESAVQKTAIDIFTRLAQAEANVHNKDVYEVHFHEVGATDSIVDIVGAAICIHLLDVDAVWCSSIELGGGFVHCAHGQMPVPAPATVEILTGIPTTRGAVQQECTTPTGAAILATLVDTFSSNPHLQVEKTGYGLGHRDNGSGNIPNLLRVHLAQVECHHTTEDSKTTDRAEESRMQARLLQCNIDDMTGEMLGAVFDLLMEEGAMDLHFTPIIMKKNRPATTLSLLCSQAEEKRFKRLLFRHTSTLGIKSIAIDKTVLPISFEQLETSLGMVTMKHAWMDGEIIRSKPELEDCRKLAQKHGLSLGEVYVQIGKVRRS